MVFPSDRAAAETSVSHSIFWRSCPGTFPNCFETFSAKMDRPRRSPAKLCNLCFLLWLLMFPMTILLYSFFQGFVITLPYCFLNTDVRSVVKNNWDRWRANRNFRDSSSSRGTRSTRNSVSMAGFHSTCPNARTPLSAETTRRVSIQGYNNFLPHECFKKASLSRTASLYLTCKRSSRTRELSIRANEWSKVSRKRGKKCRLELDQNHLFLAGCRRVSTRTRWRRRLRTARRPRQRRR